MSKTHPITFIASCLAENKRGEQYVQEREEIEAIAADYLADFREWADLRLDMLPEPITSEHGTIVMQWPLADGRVLGFATYAGEVEHGPIHWHVFLWDSANAATVADKETNHQLQQCKLKMKLHVFAKEKDQHEVEASASPFDSHKGRPMEDEAHEILAAAIARMNGDLLVQAWHDIHSEDNPAIAGEIPVKAHRGKVPDKLLSSMLSGSYAIYVA